MPLSFKLTLTNQHIVYYQAALSKLSKCGYARYQLQMFIFTISIKTVKMKMIFVCLCCTSVNTEPNIERTS